MARLAIIGAGLTSAVISRLASDDGHAVDVFDQRDHLGGNCYDFPENRSYTHKYGPHLFHTSDSRIVHFLGRFTEFTPYSHKVNAWIDGSFVPIPFSLKSLDITHPQWLAEKIGDALISNFGYGAQVSIRTLLASSDSLLSGLGEYVYEKVFKGYSVKQWGVEDPLSLDAAVLDRVPIRISRNTDYFIDKYQMLPKNGYTEMILKMFQSPLVNTFLGAKVDPESIVKNLDKSCVSINGNVYDHVFYSGKPDALLGYKYGALEYRSLHFTRSVVDVNINSIVQRPSLQLNYPSNHDFTRISDYSHIAIASGYSVSKATLLTEYPGKYDSSSEIFFEPFYPMFTKSARDLHGHYISDLSSFTGLLSVCGRLGDYRYYDMDDAIVAAMGCYRKASNHFASC